MALQGSKSNNNVVYSSKYHCVWTPQYRRSVLVGPIAKRCEPVMRQTAEKYRAEIIAWEIMPDHVPVLVEVDPQFGIHRLVKNLKGVSWHTLRQEFRTWKSRLPTLGTNRYFVSTVGGLPMILLWASMLAWNPSLSPAMGKSWTTHVGFVLPKRNCGWCSATYPAAASGLEAGVRRVGWLLACIATYSTNATISSTSDLANW